MNLKQNFSFPHIVDDENKVVSVYVHSWLGSMGAHTVGKQIWPNYKIQCVSKEVLDKLQTN